MKCEICDTQIATMWVKAPTYPIQRKRLHRGGSDVLDLVLSKPIPSCDDCGPQLGYAILAPLNDPA